MTPARTSASTSAGTRATARTPRALRRRRSAVGAAGLVAAAALAGCGGGTGGTRPAAGAAGAGASVAPPGSSPAAVGGAAGAAAGASAGPDQAPVPVESNPPGDIPDSVAFVPYRNAAGGYAFRHPEGWAQQGSGSTVTFTDKLNGVRADTAALPSAYTVEAVRREEVPRLRSTQAAFELRAVEAVTLPAGSGVKVVYRRNSEPDPVTGRRVRAEVEEYLIGTAGGRGVRLALYGPVGADNVDAYRTIAQSLRLR